MKSNKISFNEMPEALGQLISEVSDLKKMVANKHTEPARTEEEYLTPSEMCQALKISTVTLWNWDKKGITRPLRVGNLKRYRKSDLELIMVEFGKTSNK